MYKEQPNRQKQTVSQSMFPQSCNLLRVKLRWEGCKNTSFTVQTHSGQTGAFQQKDVCFALGFKARMHTDAPRCWKAQQASTAKAEDAHHAVSYSDSTSN